MMYPIINAVKGKLTMYPPVGPRRAPKPELKPEKTGSPITPVSTYTIWEMVPYFFPRIAAARHTARVCIVMGIGEKGNLMEIWAKTIVNVEKIAVRIISLKPKTVSFDFIKIIPPTGLLLIFCISNKPVIIFSECFIFPSIHIVVFYSV